MNLKGGVIIIGSLLWDNEEREKWREENLRCSEKFQVYLPIRYGRCSTSRENTYTMVFSNECCSENKLGKGWIIPLKKEIDSFEALKREAWAMGKAEKFDQGLYDNWGSVALLLNPNKEIDPAIKEEWRELLSTNDHISDLEKAQTNNEQPVIDSNGLLTISWPEEIKSDNKIGELDLLIATVTKPTFIKGQYPTASQIANAMNKVNYYKYFRQNIKHKITTSQDEKILKNIPENIKMGISNLST